MIRKNFGCTTSSLDVTWPDPSPPSPEKITTVPTMPKTLPRPTPKSSESHPFLPSTLSTPKKRDTSPPTKPRRRTSASRNCLEPSSDRCSEVEKTSPNGSPSSPLSRSCEKTNKHTNQDKQPDVERSTDIFLRSRFASGR